MSTPQVTFVSSYPHKSDEGDVLPSELKSKIKGRSPSAGPIYTFRIRYNVMVHVLAGTQSAS